MFVQIFTQSIKNSDTAYYLHHSHYLDCVHLESKHCVWQADNKTIADLINIGFAMKDNIERDRKIGINWNSSKKSDWYNIKHGIDAKVWTEYKSGIRRNVTVYTDNEELYNDLVTGFIVADSYTTKVFLRILKLKKDFCIGVGYLKESEITDELKEHWRVHYKL